jgi:hypothetical protein
VRRVRRCAKVCEGVLSSIELQAGACARVRGRCRSGTIDAAELQQLAYSCGEVLSKAQTQALLEQLDTGKTGSVSREEFQAWIEKGAPTESEDRSMAQSLKLKYKLLSRHYGRKFGGDAAAAHDAAHNTYKVATSIGDPQKVKMRATLQVQPQTPEIKAALGAAPARARQACSHTARKLSAPPTVTCQFRWLSMWLFCA